METNDLLTKKDAGYKGRSTILIRDTLLNNPPEMRIILAFILFTSIFIWLVSTTDQERNPMVLRASAYHVSNLGISILLSSGIFIESLNR